MESSINTQDVPTTIENWTKDEKFELLQALKNFGSHDIKILSETIPTKSLEEIKDAIAFYKRKATNHPIINAWKRKERRKFRASHATTPLAMWAQFLIDSLSFKDLHNETVKALQLIAEFERIPSKVYTHNIDFRKIYYLLANSLEGKTVPIDISLKSVLHKCFYDSALASKAFIRQSTYKTIMNSINDISDKEISNVSWPTNDCELALIRHLISQRAYNPFDIPENFLKPSL